MNQHTRTVPRPEVAGGPPAAHGRTGVVVVGSVNADLLTTVDQHPRPGETVLGRTLDVLPGGKGANQAVAAAQLGAQTALVGAVDAVAPDAPEPPGSTFSGWRHACGWIPTRSSPDACWSPAPAPSGACGRRDAPAV